MKSKIAFFKLGSFSHINDSVYEILHTQFPQYEIDTIDVWEDITSKNDLFNFLRTFRDYQINPFHGRNRLKRHFTQTPYLFHKVRRKLRNLLADSQYTFTFQTQSLFDCSLPGVPHFLYTDHTDMANLSYPGYGHKDLSTPEWQSLEKEIYQRASLNFTMSSHIRRSIIEDYDCSPDQVVCVYAGSNVATADLPVSDSSKYHNKNILFVGVDWERKGGPVLAKAFEQVVKVHPDAKLTIVGCSPELKLPNCTITGRIPREQVARHYEEASIFCLPTNREPFGIVFAEAMNYKLPIVATNIAAIPDFVIPHENGFMINNFDHESLTQYLIKLLDDPSLCQQFGDRGHQLGKERYTWDNTGIRMQYHIRRKLQELKQENLPKAFSTV